MLRKAYNAVRTTTRKCVLAAIKLVERRCVRHEVHHTIAETWFLASPHTPRSRHPTSISVSIGHD